MEKELKKVDFKEQIGDNILIKTKNHIPYEIYINGHELSGVSNIKINTDLTPDSFNHTIILEIKVINDLEIVNESY